MDIDNFEKEHFSILLVAFACTLVIYTLIHMIFYERYIHYRNENQELLMLKQKDALKYEYYRNRIESYENMRILYHDLKNHILVSNYDSSYLEKAKDAILKFEKVFDTGCDILNILLWEKNNEAEKMDIGFECVVDNVDLSFMDDMDVCSLIGNILDNAIEASQELLDTKNLRLVSKLEILITSSLSKQEMSVLVVQEKNLKKTFLKLQRILRKCMVSD